MPPFPHRISRNARPLPDLILHRVSFAPARRTNEA